MIVESIIAGASAYGVYKAIRSDYYDEKKEKKRITEEWNVLMYCVGTTSKNKAEQHFELLDIFLKHYGFDAIVSIPSGKKFSDLMQNTLPSIESTFKANVMMDISKGNKNSIYMRVHFMDRNINRKDKIKFDWFKIFYNNDCLTKSGELLGINSIKDIKSPDDKVVGYLINSKIPIGMSYDKIKSSYDLISKSLGKCFFDFNHKKMELETTIIYDSIDDQTKFYPIKVKPWELYVGMGHDWKPIILDYSLNANTLVGGIQGSGKTIALITAFINLCSSTKDFELYVCNIGEKEDLRVFRDVDQCKYYANSHIELMNTLHYLKKEMKRRNKLFSSSKRFCFNIHEYNKTRREQGLTELKVIHLLGDEIADFMEVEGSQKLLWDLIRKSRSAGIYVSMATQRGSRENVSSEIKGQFANQISFSQPNTASALTVVSGDDVAKRVLSLEKKREFLVDYMEGIKTAKTLFLSSEMMEHYLNDYILSEEESKANKLKLDLNGNIIEEAEEDSKEQPEMETKEKAKPSKEEKAKKPPRFINLKQNKDKQKK